jgi:hypothetical protein
MARPAGILPSGCAGGLRGFADSTSCADVELARLLASHPCGAFPPPTRRAIGAPGRAARSQRALFRRTRSKAGAGAKPRQSDALPWPLLFSFITECWPGWPAALPGVPCAAVSRGRQAAQRASPGTDSPFRAGTMPARKARPRLTDLLGRMPNKRQAGCSFSLVTFSLSTQRESNSRANGARKLFRRGAPSQSQQSNYLRCARTQLVALVIPNHILSDLSFSLN